MVLEVGLWVHLPCLLGRNVFSKEHESRVNRNRESVAARPVWSGKFEYQCTILSITCKPAAAREIRDLKQNTCLQLDKI